MVAEINISRIITLLFFSYKFTSGRTCHEIGTIVNECLQLLSILHKHPRPADCLYLCRPKSQAQNFGMLRFSAEHLLLLIVYNNVASIVDIQ